jgi:linoleoyl-CoA desaturase
MYVKSAVLLLAFASLYALLVFAAQTWWQAVPLAILLGLATAGIGMNIQHDASHHAYSRHPSVNRLFALSLELLGGSAYLWRYRHGVFHHTYVNITGHDTDIDVGLLGRLSPHQRRLPFHRWQHGYMWALYALMTIRWQLVGDLIELARGEIAGHRIPRPKGWDLVQFIGGKLVFYAIAFVLPMLFHPWWAVLLIYALTSSVTGIVLSIVFQLAHSVEDAEFAMPDGESGRIENAWAIHQAESTVDFARGSKLAALLLGGLNFQIEHHLLPRISHVHYPALSPLVEETCREFGVKFNEHRTFWSGVASHYRWLREMGRP